MRLTRGRYVVCLVLTCTLLALSPVCADSGEELNLLLRVFPENTEIFVDATQVSGSQEGYFRRYRVFENSTLNLKSPGYITRSVELSTLSANGEDSQIQLEIKLERDPFNSSMEVLAQLSGGSQPKSVIFSPDGSKFFSALLAGRGIDVYDSQSLELLASLDLAGAAGHPESRGFVEFAVHEERNELWVSQMDTALVHVVDLQTLEYVTSFSSRGVWTKVITFDRSGRLAFVSNWLSEDISVFETEGYRYLGTIPVGGIPRGLALHPENNQLYVADYETGRLISYNISRLTERLEAGAPGTVVWEPDLIADPVVLYDGGGAQRHIAIGVQSMRMYVSDMYYGSIDVYDLDNNSRLARVQVGPKLNTIALDPSEEHLYISSRGTNNPKTYLIPGPDFGKILVMNTDSHEISDWAWGHNQPTGLAVSPDGLMLVSSDFLDRNLQVYNISAISAANPLLRALGLRRRIIAQALYRRNKDIAAVEFVAEQAEAGTSGR